MTTIYVDNIAPNLQSKISAPNLDVPIAADQIIQTKTLVIPYSSSISTNSDASVYLGQELTITPKKANSHILLSIHGGYMTYSSGSPLAVWSFYRAVNSGSFSFLDFYQTARLNNYYYGIGHNGRRLDENSYTLGDTIKYRWYGRCISGTTTVYAQYGIGGQQSPIVWTAQEIAQ
jgi:hypothetical protein